MPPSFKGLPEVKQRYLDDDLQVEGGVGGHPVGMLGCLVSSLNEYILYQ